MISPLALANLTTPPSYCDVALTSPTGLQIKFKQPTPVPDATTPTISDAPVGTDPTAQQQPTPGNMQEPGLSDVSLHVVVALLSYMPQDIHMDSTLLKTLQVSEHLTLLSDNNVTPLKLKHKDS